MSIYFLSQIKGLEDKLSLLHMDAFPKGQGWKEKDFKGLLDISFHHLIVSFDSEKKIKGFLIHSLILDEAEILTFCVHPAYQKKGVGGELITAFLTQLQKQHVKTAFLEVAENNKVAIKLYNRYGFIQKGRRLNYYENGINALLMVKEL